MNGAQNEKSKWKIFIKNKSGSTLAMHLRRSEGVGKIITGKDRLKKRKRKTEKAVGKGHTGFFRHVPSRSWKIGN